MTVEECNKIFKVWAQNYFNDLNSWAQIAKATISFEMSQINSGTKDSKQKAQAMMKFEKDAHEPIFAQSVEISNKQAKQVCYEKITKELISRGDLGIGFKNKESLDQQLKKYDKLIEQSSNLNGQVKIREVNIAQPKQTVILNHINSDQIDKALELLCEFIKEITNPELYKLSWQKLGLIWLTILQKQDLKLAQQFIEILRCEGNLLKTIAADTMFIKTNITLQFLDKLYSSMIFVANNDYFFSQIQQLISNSFSVFEKDFLN
ncbi:UNKNOWN [Stylonychia lemnae]|uniref:Uncharacterized protein n=1 Tax=Stylonychia lemnae TaxID=5949 RepID=A0A078A078_STYLE|nr:UNKNOWN [Stylonychia lemnae]|eukprot:CDW74828.1 UNKNOWN [Stylonychia lemnae]